MPQPSDNLRDRLLAALPQPENLTAYREETNTLLTKHQRALRWDNISIQVLIAVAFVLVFLWSGNRFHLDPDSLHFFQLASGLTFVGAVIWELHYRIYKSEIANLKEIKQVQLQILELQASLQKQE